MNQLTFVDKIQVLFSLLFSSPIIIGIFAFSLILMIILFLSNKLNKKIIKTIFIIIYIALIGFTIFKYGSYFLTSIDSFVTLFMANIYFPIIPIYVLMMFISFIIMIITLSGKNKSKLTKIINTIFFTLIQMLFAIFIFVIEKNKIDVSSNANIYTNEQTLTLLELGMGLFVIWMIILLITFYLKKADVIFRTKKTETKDNYDDYINDYNEPSKNIKNLDNPYAKNDGFTNGAIPNLIPEFNLYNSNEEEILSFDEDNNNQNNPANNNQNINTTLNNNINAFNNFEFINIPTATDKKNEVEIIDFDD